MKLIHSLLLIGGIMFFSGCSGNKLDHYKDRKPVIKLEEYFNGPIKAWGIVQNWKGEVVTQFDVDMIGHWENGTGTLEEEFTYYDGTTQQRVWTITRTGEHTYEGAADDIINKATGEVRGNAVRWNYRMDLEVDGSTYRITFDDWMWQMHDGVLINRSYLKKFGITVAELTLIMQKQ